MSASPPKTSYKLFILIAVIAGIVGAWVANVILANQHALPALHTGTVISPPRPLANFTMQDFHNNAVTPATLGGRWSVLFFGYTSCPDVCPTTLTQLTAVWKALSDIPAVQKPQFVFVSVDSKRDTPEKLAGYVHYFSADFQGWTGTEEQVKLLTKAIGVPVIIQSLPDGGYNIDHSASLFIINPEQQLYAVVSPPYQTTDLANDLRSLAMH
ncbi:MAG TPA: SCO family protein, partial [Steroidobacteraceae bacterium]|jgi:protein SCO1/2|nr:SCO family protein [Steroidobacteraceae bacterium]